MAFANAKWRLRIATSDFEYLSEGAYGVAFVDRKQRRIRKVYRPAHNLKHAHNVFNAEVGAYQKATATDDLRGLVPHFFGTCSNIKIVDGDGNDVTAEFYPALAFEAEFIDGEFQKNTIVEESERQRIFELIRKHGIRHVKDTSVTVQGGSIAKIIDFALQEFIPQWDDDL